MRPQHLHRLEADGASSAVPLAPAPSFRLVRGEGDTGSPGGPYLRYGKPVLDRLLGAVLFLLALPVLLGIALAIWIKLGSPVLIRQQRAGLGGRPFPMYKFRTMDPDRRRRQRPFVGTDRRRTHKHPEDPRHTDLGRVLRALSLDELPQLLNIIKGDMSLVGPRPELMEVVDRYEPWQHHRHGVRPGLTGLWQITHRGTEMHKHTEVDLAYIERLSFTTDCKILLRTVPALLGRGARGV
jgi:lipopolysaccharide/colanic/teichoic acid biosynthesis glycosyltransferase